MVHFFIANVHLLAKMTAACCFEGKCGHNISQGDRRSILYFGGFSGAKTHITASD
jgi:hypothetical protein